MALFRRQRTSTCFYCHSTVSHSSSSSGTFDPNFFRCPYCACWNRYDAHGQIVGDEPAMHDERLNIESFMKRGTPDLNHLPSYTTTTSDAQPSFFCHTCRTNQTLLVNLLAAYLPDPSDPVYASRKAALPTYRDSLYARYPPVCNNCAPAVNAEIARKDEMARTRALGGALRVSSPGLRRPGGSDSIKSSSTSRRNAGNLWLWKIRGTLWIVTVVSVITGYAVALTSNLPERICHMAPILPVLVPVSLCWTFWDPTYSLQCRTNAHGRGIRVDGRRRFLILQSYAWLSRLVTSLLLGASRFLPDYKILHTFDTSALYTPNVNTWNEQRLFLCSSLALEIIVLFLSCLSITIRKPAPIRLIDTSAHHALASLNANNDNTTHHASSTNSVTNSSMHAGVSEPDHFSTLSLSSNPVVLGPNTNSVNPMFGQPSLLQRPPQRITQTNGDLFEPSAGSGHKDNDDDDTDNVMKRTRPRSDPDAMDWEPASPAKASISRADHPGGDDGTWMRQQRFFPPEEPTGLEGLFMRTRLVDEDDPARMGATASQRSLPGSRTAMRWHWGWVYSASAVPVLALITGLWLTGRTSV